MQKNRSKNSALSRSRVLRDEQAYPRQHRRPGCKTGGREERLHPKTQLLLGGCKMTDSDSWEARQLAVQRYRDMQRETTDPLAYRMLGDIIVEMQADLDGDKRNNR